MQMSLFPAFVSPDDLIEAAGDQQAVPAAAATASVEQAGGEGAREKTRARLVAAGIADLTMLSVLVQPHSPVILADRQTDRLSFCLIPSLVLPSVLPCFSMRAACVAPEAASVARLQTVMFLVPPLFPDSSLGPLFTLCTRHLSLILLTSSLDRTLMCLPQLTALTLPPDSSALISASFFPRLPHQLVFE